MQAKISYTVKIEDVPSEVNNLLSPVRDMLEAAGRTAFLVTHDRVQKTIEQIDTLRKTLLQLDSRLGDCYSILVGYNRAFAESLTEKEQDEHTEQPVPE